MACRRKPLSASSAATNCSPLLFRCGFASYGHHINRTTVHVAATGIVTLSGRDAASKTPRRNFGTVIIAASLNMRCWSGPLSSTRKQVRSPLPRFSAYISIRTDNGELSASDLIVMR